MPDARVWFWPGFHHGCKTKVLCIQLSFFCVQFRCTYIYCSVNDNFVFLIINRQQYSCLAWLLFLGVILEWPFLAHGVGVSGLSSLSSGWWRPGERECSFPWTLFSACCIRSLRGICQVDGPQPDTTYPLLCLPTFFFSTDLRHRSHDPEHCNCWSDLCCTRHFSSSIHSSNMK